MLHSENGSPNPLCYHQNLLVFDLVMAYEMSALSVPSPLAVRKDTSLTGGNTSPLSARDPLPPDLNPASVPDTLLGVGGKHTGEVISPVIPRAPQTLSRRHVRIRNMQVGKISREKPRPTESLIRNSWEISRSEFQCRPTEDRMFGDIIVLVCLSASSGLWCCWVVARQLHSDFLSLPLGRP